MFRRKPAAAQAHPPPAPARLPAPARPPAPAPVSAGQPQPTSNTVFDESIKSIEYAQRAMEQTQVNLSKAQTDKESRNKIISKASEVVNALLDPALQVANLLDGLGAFFPPCKVASNTLQTIVQIEQRRRENDVRIAVVIIDISALLATLGSLKPGFQDVQTLVGPLSKIMVRIDDLMQKFGEFGERFYDASAFRARLKHLLQSSSNKGELANFREQVAMIKADLTHLLSQQSVLMLAGNTQTLARIEKKLAPVMRFFASLSTQDEEDAEEFVRENGGEDAVKDDDDLLEVFAQAMGEALTPAIIRAVKESTEAAISQSHASFMLKFQYHLDMKLDESQEEILKELHEGPHELIKDPDLKIVWKEISGKETSIKRRRFIDGVSYYFNRQFKAYRAVHNRAEQGNAWTREIINKVPYHSAICDAIDDDASGYISVGEVIEFMHNKPSHWSVPEWIAYWAYGWDADNVEYSHIIQKALGRLYSIRDSGCPNAEHVTTYLDDIEKELTTIVNSVYVLNTLEPSIEPKMDRLRKEWCDSLETLIKRRLKTVNYRFNETTFSAITGVERVEATFFPFAYLLLSRHLAMFEKPEVGEGDTQEAISAMRVLLKIVENRIVELKAIWRRQRIDVEVQVRYYANGFFEDYYKEYLRDSLDRPPKPDPEDWNQDDAWQSEEEGEELVGYGASTNEADAQQAQGEDPPEGEQGGQDPDESGQGYSEGAQGYSGGSLEEGQGYNGGYEQGQESNEGGQWQTDGQPDESQQQTPYGYGWNQQQQYQRSRRGSNDSGYENQGGDEQYAREQARRGDRMGYDSGSRSGSQSPSGGE